MAASATASSTSGVSVTHTGQPGPMMTDRSRGKTARRPKRAMACSWLPQTCITFTGERPMAFTSAGRFWSAMSGFLRDLGAGGHLAAHVRSHEVIRPRVLQHLLEEGQGLAHLVRRDAADCEADVIQDVVADGDGLVDDVEPEQLRHAEEVDRRLEAVHLEHSARDTETHEVVPSESRARLGARVRDDELTERDSAIPGRDEAGQVYPKRSRKLREYSIDEACVGEAAAGEHDRQPAVTQGGEPHQLGARGGERAMKAGRHEPRRAALEEIAHRLPQERPPVDRPGGGR